MSRVTSRGILWEVLAPVIRWPLRSPARLATVVGAVFLVLVLSARLGSGDTPMSPDPSQSPSTSGSSTLVQSSPSSSAVPSSTVVGTPVASPTAAAVALPPAASAAATSFLTAWARPNVAQADWFAALKPLSTPDLGAGLARTDPRNVPVLTVTGDFEAREVSPNLAAPTRAVLVADTTTGLIAVTVVLQGKAWLVQQIAPYEDHED